MRLVATRFKRIFHDTALKGRLIALAEASKSTLYKDPESLQLRLIGRVFVHILCLSPTTCRWLQSLDVVDSEALSCVIEYPFTRCLGSLSHLIKTCQFLQAQSFLLSAIKPLGVRFTREP